MELTERKKKVLRSVVDLYIRTAEPVGSKAITALPDMKYSSATTFSPSGQCLRAQVVTFLYRADQIPEPGPEPQPFPDPEK